MKKKLITLAKELDFSTTEQYFEYLIDSHINGQFTQCKILFNEMKKDDQKDFITYVHNAEGMEKVYNFYFNLL